MRKKSKIIILIILIVFIIIVIVNLTRGKMYIAPSIEKEEILQDDDGKIKYKNNIENIDIGNREVINVEENLYLQIEIINKVEEDKINLPIGIGFVNLDGDVIYNTGCVIDVLLIGMIDEINVVISDEIADMIEKDEIDHIEINEL